MRGFRGKWAGREGTFEPISPTRPTDIVVLRLFSSVYFAKMLMIILASMSMAVLAINQSSSPFDVVPNKGIRARYPTMMRESAIPKTMERPQKNTRHVVESAKGKTKGRNPLVEFSGNLRRRKPVSARYKSIFGYSKPMKGIEFTPTNIDHYTGKMAQSRRQTFKWSPNGQTMDYFLFARRHH